MSAWYHPMPGETLPCNGFLITPENPGHVFIASCSSKITPGDTGNVLAQTKDQPWRVEAVREHWGSTPQCTWLFESVWEASGPSRDAQAGRAGRLQGCREGLSWTEFKGPEQTLSWWRAGLVEVHLRGHICCPVPRRGGCLSSKRRITAGLLETSSASWEVTQVMEILPWRSLAVTRNKITFQ